MKQNVFEQSSKQETFSEPSSHDNAKYSTWKSTSNEIEGTSFRRISKSTNWDNSTEPNNQNKEKSFKWGFNSNDPKDKQTKVNDGHSRRSSNSIFCFYFSVEIKPLFL